MPVPPPPVRPSIAVDGGAMRSEDDLTYKPWRYHQGVGQSAAESGRPVKAIRARLKGKEGRLRGNLMGKRVVFFCTYCHHWRSESGAGRGWCTEKYCYELDFPERVTPYNYRVSARVVRNGPHYLPRCSLRRSRHCFVLFNRQPSLHKDEYDESSSASYALFHIPMNLSYAAYNADFDGDEMNMHVPQSEETRAELSQVAGYLGRSFLPKPTNQLMVIGPGYLCGIVNSLFETLSLIGTKSENILLWVPDWDGSVPIPAILKTQSAMDWVNKSSVLLFLVVSIFIGSPDPKSSNPFLMMEC
ncbi:beta and beta-prime subunits of DNA dependent RNA-polymerase [Gymnopus androsaceus JB14]|uniref:DNA-directed RNA polymerase n=1 Tax=Gymnopus androsaceus JB14 TaxID=1447944 RepID=A0A6A4HJF8_9AGAR|nr:beta and beta-prime subunits of DNA dependent RNA-polymerase [Gymnopus androsaceus JB14]